MNNQQKKAVISLFKQTPSVKLAYFFGSKAIGTDGPLSDYDFAVYTNQQDVKEIYNLKFKLMADISRILQTNNVDVAMINLSKSPEFKYNIIKNGQLLVDKEPYRLLIEPTILNEYFDFYSQLKQYNLTRV